MDAPYAVFDVLAKNAGEVPKRVGQILVWSDVDGWEASRSMMLAMATLFPASAVEVVPVGRREHLWDGQSFESPDRIEDHVKVWVNRGFVPD